ncbi:MAG: N-acetylmuramoyl-L-alanine amidase [Lachnospiraceae bacterium]|jgi:N-acetylmuramoyl-L-alanine amidase|nr:N-acetylmuramoyl-L-alanine amidase [Lachnospiraceae bacterium]
MELMKRTGILSFAFAIAVMAVVVFAIENRPLLAVSRYDEGQTLLVDDPLALSNPPANNEDGQPHTNEQGSDVIWIPEIDARGIIDNDNESVEALRFESGGIATGHLAVPVPPGTLVQAVAIENHYMSEELRIVIAGVDADFFANTVISGNRDGILSGSYTVGTGGVTLNFVLDDIYECVSIMENGYIYIELVPPRMLNEKIIVIDPAHGGSEYGIVANGVNEKDVTLAVAVRLKELLDETDIKVYYTRLFDNNVDEQRRVRIANSTKADMLIRIECDADNDSLLYGTTTVYNSTFFIPRFGSIDLANILEREVVLSIIGNAVGLKPATSGDYVIANAAVPAAAIRIGYLTNAQEAILLQREDYLEKAAAGIFNAIMKAYEFE